MDKEQVRVMLGELETRFKKLNVETAWLAGGENQIGDTLRALLPVTKEGGHVLLEVMVDPLDADTDLLDIFISIIMEVGPGYEELKEAMLEWNIDSPIGYFGVYRQSRTFFFRYTYPFPAVLPPEDLAVEAAYLIDVCAAVTSAVYPEAVRISGHS